MGSVSSDNAGLDIPSREYVPLVLRRLYVDLSWGLCYMRIGLSGKPSTQSRNQRVYIQTMAGSAADLRAARHVFLRSCEVAQVALLLQMNILCDNGHTVWLQVRSQRGRAHISRTIFVSCLEMQDCKLKKHIALPLLYMCLASAVQGMCLYNVN